ncbi:Allergen Fus c 2, partial [Delphinella strobiligena]
PTSISSAQEFQRLLSSSRVVVADFYADWCGPCKAIAPFYASLASKHSKPNSVTFTKINTDEQRSITQTHGITAMPSFLVFKSGKEVARIQGADPKKLENAVKSAVSDV